MNDQDSLRLTRGGWGNLLIASWILITGPMLLDTLLGAGEVTIPRWVGILACVSGCVGLFFAALNARLASNTLSGKFFCAVSVLFGYVVAIWQIVEILQR
ncbi:hypothetical protein [Burkholderia multivorans]|uniref:hypothetical protein n=1 Tax=Burkholderia multivorans TaxID=87883 RepID=UPI0021BF169E|nr:hypothetical protein [Burkholderia multivorans]